MLTKSLLNVSFAYFAQSRLDLYPFSHIHAISQSSVLPSVCLSVVSLVNLYYSATRVVDENLCYLSADPHLVGYGQARADVNMPCRYRASR